MTETNEYLKGMISALIQKNSNYTNILLSMCDVDDQCTIRGWEYSDVQGMFGGHIKVLLEIDLIKYTYNSNKFKEFRVNCDVAELRSVLNDIVDSHEAEAEITSVEQTGAVECVVVPESSILKFQKLLADGEDMVEYFGNAVNPKVKGLNNVKQAMVMCLASSGDQFGDRGRIHILMYGDPGSAKSALSNWLVYQLGAVGCSQRTTKVGLTGSAQGGVITPGALARGNGGVVVIDELDKFENKDRQAMLESMEEGKITIEAGGMTAVHDAECRLVGCANKIDKFSPELLDRFDFKFNMKAPRGDDEKEVVDSIIEHWCRNKPGYDGKELKEYLGWIKGFTPEFSDGLRNNVKQLMRALIDIGGGLKERESVRRRESILRVAYTRAKLNHRDLVIGDFLSAIETLHPNLDVKTSEVLKELAYRLK